MSGTKTNKKKNQIKNSNKNPTTNSSCINYFLQGTKSSRLKSGKLEETLNRRETNINCPTTQTQLHETAEVKLVTIYSTFNDTKEEKKWWKNHFFRFFTFVRDNIISVWIDENSRDNGFLEPCEKSAIEILTSQDIN